VAGNFKTYTQFSRRARNWKKNAVSKGVWKKQRFIGDKIQKARGGVGREALDKLALVREPFVLALNYKARLREETELKTFPRKRKELFKESTGGGKGRPEENCPIRSATHQERRKDI